MMKESGLVEKNLKSTSQQGKSPQTNKRKRRQTEQSDDVENIYPPKKIPATATYIDEACESSSPVADLPEFITSPLPDHHEPSTWSELRTSTCFLTPSTSGNQNRTSPLPALPWADGGQVWSLMRHNDQKSTSQRDPDMFQRHPTLQPRMRAILLDWLIEVCEVYKLHRETYYLAMDYIDRYLSRHTNVPKNQLQLIGITCLFIAAKVEEIYPPKINEFAYVTDGACTEEEILGKELVVLKGLGWNLSPVSIPGWLDIYMQIECGDWSKPNTFVYAQYGGLQYSQAAQLLDLASLDEGSLKFSYSQLAAGAVYHTMGRECALRVSRLSWEDLGPCVRWLNAFALTVAEERAQQMLRSAIPHVDSNSSSGLRASVPNIVADESHRIQTHVIDLDMLEAAQHRHSEELFLFSDSIDFETILDSASSPDQSGILTPPSSSQKNSPTSPRLLPQVEPYNT